MRDARARSATYVGDAGRPRSSSHLRAETRGAVVLSVAASSANGSEEPEKLLTHMWCERGRSRGGGRGRHPPSKARHRPLLHVAQMAVLHRDRVQCSPLLELPAYDGPTNTAMVLFFWCAGGAAVVGVSTHVPRPDASIAHLRVKATSDSTPSLGSSSQTHEHKAYALGSVLWRGPERVL